MKRNLVCVGLILMAAACSSPDLGGNVPPDAATPPAELSLENSTLTADRTSGILADGMDAVTLTVTARDTAGDPVRGRKVTLSVTGDGNKISDLALDTDAEGHARFALSSTKAETKTASASIDGALLPATVMLTFDAGTAAKLVFQTQPMSTTAGASLGTIKVAAIDAGGNVATAFNGEVTLTLKGGQGTVPFTPVKAQAANGVAEFSNVKVGVVGTGYTLSAAGQGVEGANSAAFNITAGAEAMLSFEGAPTAGVAGVALSPVQVAVVDASGNPVPSTASVTIALDMKPGTATLKGTTTVAAVNGVATFTDLKIETAGAGYTLSATASGLVSAISAPFSVTAGAPHHLAFSVQPSNAVAGASLNPDVRVVLDDEFGNLISGNATVSLSLASGPNGAMLSGPASLAASNGTAIFSGLSLDKAGSYTLSASAPGYAAATSDAFTVTAAAASKVRIVNQPATVAAGATLSAIAIALEDAFGNATASTASVTVAVATGPAGATLSGTATVAAVSGSATFSDLSLDTAGAYTLTFTAAGVGQATSASFNVTPATGSKLRVATQPANAAAATAIAPAIEVSLEDNFGNRVSSFSTVTASIASGPSGATLSGTVARTANAGLATFDDLSLDKAGSYTLSFSVPGFTSVTSAPFTIAPGAPHHLGFHVQPSAAAAGVAIAPAVEVELLDAHDNRIGATDSVSIEIATGPTGASLSGTVSVAAVAGVASFADLSLDKVGSYTLTAKVAGYADAKSASFDISAGAPGKLTFSVSPSNGTAGKALTSFEVSLFDRFDNPITDAKSVTLAAATGPAGATLGGTVTRTSASGKVTFDDVTLDKAGSYTLAATSTGFSGATSASFDIAAAVAARLAVTVQPVGGKAGATLAPAIQVAVQDAFGNVTADTSSITAAVDSGPVTTLGGTLVKQAAAGVATFDDLHLDKAGHYTLSFAANGLQGATSTGFDIAASAGTKLVFSSSPADLVAGKLVTPVAVAFEDAFGNRIVDTASVTVAIGTGPSGAALLGTATRAPSNGVATFDDLHLNTAGSYVLTATAQGFSAASSATFNVSPGPTARLAFATEPTTTEVRTPFDLTVDLFDTYGNRVVGETGTVALTLSGGTGALLGTASVTPNAGKATFSGVSIDDEGSAYVLTAKLGGISQASATFAVTDTTPPSTVADLAASAVTFTSLKLTWTAPGDDGARGRAATNEVRYSTSPITAQNFASATLVGTAASAAAGSTETVPVSGLTSGTTYYFALKVTDGAGNSSFTTISKATAACNRGYTGAACDTCATGFRETSPGVCEDYCTNPNPCTSPAASCGGADGQTAIVFPAQRACTATTTAPFYTCEAPTTTDCAAQGKLCNAGACVADPCATTTCPAAAPSCGSDGITLTTPKTHCSAVMQNGSYVAQCVNDPATTTDCSASQKLCHNGACLADPCAGMTCTPKAASCDVDNVTLTTPTASCQRVDQNGSWVGQCVDGQATTTKCDATNQVCSAGSCQTAIPPAAGSLLVTEILHTPAAVSVEGQWFEVRNLSGNLLDLAGLTVTNVKTGQSFTLPATKPLPVPVNGLLVFGYSADKTKNGGAAVDVAWGSLNPQFGLASDGNLKLSLNTTTVEAVDYGTIAPSVPAGTALNLSSKAQGQGGNQQKWYWCAATTAMSGGDKGTPGAANGDCGVSLNPPVDFCKLQFPLDAGSLDAPGKITVYGHVYEPSVTDRSQPTNDNYPFLVGELVYGPKPATGSADPTSWTAVAATFNAGFTNNNPSNNDDEMQADLSPASSGDYLFGYRFRMRDPGDGSLSAPVYCDRNGVVGDLAAGSWGTVTVYNPTAEILAARTTPDGANLSLPINGAYVTFLKPTDGVSGAGFFVQAQKTGPAILVNIDPALLSPIPVVGDRVSFTINTLAQVGSMKATSSVSNFKRVAQGSNVTSFVQDLSAANDVVTGLTGYEGELMSMTGTISASFGAASNGFQTATFDTSAITGNTSLKVRLTPATIATYELVPGCKLTVKQTPLWRGGTQAQPTAWANSDLTGITCPAPKVVSAAGSAPTSVVVNFDRSINPTSINANGSQFTIPGLVVSAAVPTSGNAKQVTLTTTTQLTTSYTVTVASTVLDNSGTAVDATSNKATFTGFGPATHVVISQYRVRGPNGGNDEFIELYNPTATAVAIGGWKVNGSNNGGTTSTRATITAGVTLQPHKFYLLGFSGTGTYSGAATPDLTYSSGITDDGGIALLNGTTVIDQVGMSNGSAYKEGTTLAPMTQNTDTAYLRRFAGSAVRDSDDNGQDFSLISPATPRNSQTAALP